MRNSLLIGLLFSFALAANDVPAQSSPDRQTSHDVGPPPLLLVFGGSDSNFQPVVFTINEDSTYRATAPAENTPVADTTTKQQPEGQSVHAHKPAQDDHPLHPRGTVATVGNRPKQELPAFPERLPALHLSQAWSIPHRAGQLHRTLHY